ncbi:MAG: Fic family protein [Alphaproteobacteria bacterium]|nr:Fic family protein [Alphaproteobacteria bacterium]
MAAGPHRGPHGRTVRGAGGYSAFVPAPLPPPLVWDEELVSTLSDADRAIGRLAGEGRRFPNPEIFIVPFLRREAVLSSRIEGTRTTLEELLAAQAGAVVGVASEDLEEVVNYVDALEYGLERLDTLPLSLRLIREMHERLMRGVRGDTATPGEFRRSQNWIGPPGCALSEASYVPPPADALMGCLGALERFLHDHTLPPLVHAGLAHAQFEAAHPFLDGNGRVGRLLITLLLVEREILPSPLLYLSAYFEASREDYYAHLLAVTQEGAWERWLRYFLRGVQVQAQDAIERMGEIDRLLAEWQEALVGVRTGRPEEVLRLFVGSPFRTVGGVAEALGMAYTTARRAIERLESAGIVSLVGAAKRNRIYCARDMLGVLEAPRVQPRKGPDSPRRRGPVP